MPEAGIERVLGFDCGSKRIGLAFGQAVTRTATPLAVVANRDTGPDWHAIDAAVREWQPQALVVGLPLTLDGGEQPASARARRFAQHLGTRYGLPVHTQDERLSSVEAAQRFAQARRDGTRRAKHAEGLDSIAAQVIVENFLGAGARSAECDCPTPKA